PHPDGPTKTTNFPSSISRSAPWMTVVSSKFLRTPCSVIRPIEHLVAAVLSGYLTAPKVSPRTSCFWQNHPSTRIGAIAIVEAADSLAQNRPSGLEYEAMKAVSGAAPDEVRFKDQTAAVQARITHSSSAENMPSSAIGARTSRAPLP